MGDRCLGLVEASQQSLTDSREWVAIASTWQRAPATKGDPASSAEELAGEALAHRLLTEPRRQSFR